MKRKNKRSRRRSSIRPCGDLNLSINASSLSFIATPAVNRRRDFNTNFNASFNAENIDFNASNVGMNPMITPVGSIRTQRIHRLNRKSNTDLLMEVLLREDLSSCPQMAEIRQEMKLKLRKSKKKTKRIGFDDLTGLRSVGRMDKQMERECLFLLKLGADALLLNADGVSPIFVAMHYTNALVVIEEMLRRSVGVDVEELNQTYVFVKHGTLSLLDVALRVGEAKVVKLGLEHGLMPTVHSMQREPKVELLSFCKANRMTKLGTRLLKEQWFEAVENLDIEYMESILCHGIDIDIQRDVKRKSALYWLVEQPFDIYDQEDAMDQFNTVEWLLKKGANSNHVDRSGSPMLVYPLQRSGRINIKLVDLLLFYRADLRAKVGETARSLYQYAKDNCVCEEILKTVAIYYKNCGKTAAARGGSKSASKKAKAKVSKVKTVEVKEIDNPELDEVIQTKSVVRKSYTRKRKGAKDGV